MVNIILDASALLALLNQEPGADVVARFVASGTAICSVNLAEVVGKLTGSGMPLEIARHAIAPLGIQVVPFDEELAYVAGYLDPLTRPLGLGLGDRCCIALGKRSALPVLTGDAVWASAELGTEVRLIR